jgi:adenine C2-methylase RlmN of 23S rRNA A2503 and tRNA A37
MTRYVPFFRTDDPIEIHYTLIETVNDSDAELNLLCELLKRHPIPIKFLKFNPINSLNISPREALWVSSLQEQLPDLKIITYSPPGREIGSSCGEFTKHYYHIDIETADQLEEFTTWKKQHEIFD